MDRMWRLSSVHRYQSLKETQSTELNLCTDLILDICNKQISRAFEAVSLNLGMIVSYLELCFPA